LFLYRQGEECNYNYMNSVSKRLLQDLQSQVQCFPSQSVRAFPWSPLKNPRTFYKSLSATERINDNLAFSKIGTRHPCS